MDEVGGTGKKPHVICISLPAQSHLMGMLKLAELLHRKGLQVTFVNTEYIHDKLFQNSVDDLHSLDDGSSCGFRFETIPDGIPRTSEDDDGTEFLMEHIQTTFLTPFLHLAAKLPTPPTCIISDGFMSLFTIEAAQKLGIPVMLYWTLSACGFMATYQIPSLIDKGLAPLKDESYLTNGYLDTIIDWIPGMEGIRLKDLNSATWTTDPSDRLLVKGTQNSHNVSHNIFHTFDALEPSIVNVLLSMFHHVYTVGPLQLHLNHIPTQEKQSKLLNFNGYNLRKEEPECFQWLQSKEPNSVIYVNFGSSTKMPQQYLKEFAWGLANSNHYFLWIIRSDLVVGESSALPPEFEEHLKKRGFIASWCSQEKVLNHPSVGGFLTHCGWGSTIESLSAGVPMICWPYLWDQLTNCRYICNKWEVGLELGKDVKREELSKLVQELMGEGGHKIRNRAMEWQQKARCATGPNGSSSINVNKLIEEITVLSRHRKMDTVATTEKKPHVIFIPLPAQSHMKAMLKLAELLHYLGLQITFVNTEYIHKRLIRSSGSYSLDGAFGFRFETIPDSIPRSSEDDDGSEVLLHYVETTFLAPFLDLATNLPSPPTCIISDGFMSAFTIEAAQKLGIPIMLYWTFSACGFMGIYQVQSLIDKGLAPLKDESYLTNGYLETLIDWIPGMEGIRLQDMNSIIRTTDPDDKFLTFCIEAIQKSHNIIHHIFHTFDSLEVSIVDVLSSMFPKVYTVGPVQLLLNQKPNKEKQTEMSKFSGYSLWKEEPECFEWLQSKEPNSVIYVSFGSTTIMSLHDLLEMGWGLADSNHYFIWVIRSDLLDRESTVLPPEFEEGIKKRGFISSWCSQEKVLNHPSVGGFLTHCGWGSTIESLSAGVPMICWPYLWDQFMNCRYICKEWEVGLEMGKDVKREEVSKLVKELMGEGGQKLRNKAIEWQEHAQNATSPIGSSTLNVIKLIEEITMLSRN